MGRIAHQKNMVSKRPSARGAVKVGEAAREAGCLYGEHGDGSATLRVSEITAAPCGLPFAYV
jgi:hypothetical protein